MVLQACDDYGTFLAKWLLDVYNASSLIMWKSYVNIVKALSDEKATNCLLWNILSKLDY